MITFKSTYAEIMLNQITTKVPNYPKNDNGQTYGSATDSISADTLPHLIHAGSVDGNAGYLLKKDYLGESGRNVQLYDVDGETVIGVFHIGGK